MEAIFLFLPLLLFSVVVHEVAHGAVAEWWGDPTARMLGRLTLNPIPHLDVFGSIIVPALLALTPGSVIFGWAKPVPVTPENFRDRRWGDITVSLAGPASNVALALALGGIVFATRAATGTVPEALFQIAQAGIFLNFILAIFNLLPIPPLDGSHVVAQLLPPSLAYSYRSIGRYGLLILLGLLFLGLLNVVFAPAFLATRLVLGLALGGA